MFNLIEITMAIAVVGIGLAGILVLFPPAIEANRVANNENYIGGIVETVQSFTENHVRQDWTKINDFPTSGTTLPNKETTFPPTWTAVTGFPGLYTVDAPNGIYGVKSDDNTICMHLRIWRGEPPVVANTNLATSSNSAKLYIELSWPVIVPHANREKRFYVFDLYEGN